MPDYQNGKIYVIICNKTGERYFGSTTQPLCKRLAGHISQRNCGYGSRSKSIILRGDYDMVLLEDYPCNSLSELMKRECYYIRNNECINRNMFMCEDYLPPRPQPDPDRLQKARAKALADRDKKRQERLEQELKQK